MRAWVPLLILALASCAFPSARDQLGEVMQKEVGKTLDDPGSYRAQNPKLRLGARRLSNGNAEEEYLAGFRDNCHVLFEVDPAGKVVRWRYSDAPGNEDCILADPEERENPKKPPAKK